MGLDRTHEATELPALPVGLELNFMTVKHFFASRVLHA